METAGEREGFVESKDPQCLRSAGVPSQPLLRAERGSGRGPCPARTGCQAIKSTALLSTAAAGQGPLLVGQPAGRA